MFTERERGGGGRKGAVRHLSLDQRKNGAVQTAIRRSYTVWLLLMRALVCLLGAFKYLDGDNDGKAVPSSFCYFNGLTVEYISVS